jgi:CRP-like cAMP-binding protein
MMTVIEKVLFLQNVDVFSSVPSEQLAYLAAVAGEIDCSSGDSVYKEGDASTAMYLVLHGRVRLHRGDNEIAQAGPREAFGTWALFDQEPRVASATTMEDTRLLKIDRDDFVDLLADHVQITEGVLKTMVDRLRGLVDRVNVNNTPRS